MRLKAILFVVLLVFAIFSHFSLTTNAQGDTDWYLKLSIFNPKGDEVTYAEVEPIPDDQQLGVESSTSVTLDLAEQEPYNRCTPGLEGAYYLVAETNFDEEDQDFEPDKLFGPTLEIFFDDSELFCTEECTTVAGVDYQENVGCCGDDGSHIDENNLGFSYDEFNFTGEPYTYLVSLSRGEANPKDCSDFFSNKPPRRAFGIQNFQHKGAKELYNLEADDGTLGFCSISTPIGYYDRLILINKESEIDWSCDNDRFYNCQLEKIKSKCNDDEISAGFFHSGEEGEGVWLELCSKKVNPSDNLPVTLLVPYTDRWDQEKYDVDKSSYGFEREKEGYIMSSCPEGYEFSGIFKTYPYNFRSTEKSDWYESWNSLFGGGARADQIRKRRRYEAIGLWTNLNLNNDPWTTSNWNQNFNLYAGEIGVCSKIITKDYTQKQDAEDCGYTNGNYFCSKIKDIKWQWIDKTIPGQVFQHICNNKSAFILTSENLYACAESLPVGTRSFVVQSATDQDTTQDFLCSNNMIYQCRGDDLPLPRQNIEYRQYIGDKDTFATRMNVGEKVLVSKEEITSKGFIPLNTGSTEEFQDEFYFYCLEDGSWVEDLDGTDQKSCELAGFTWSGTKCCGEDVGEFYNDRSYACWDSIAIPPGGYAIELDIPDDKDDGVYKSIINYNGTFYGCNIDLDLLSIRDTHENKLLITNSAECGLPLKDAFGPGKHAYCSSNGEWKETEYYGRREIKSISWEQGGQQTECCAPTDCWDGMQCIPNEINNSQFRLTKGLSCLDGQWKKREVKYTWNKAQRGFCPETMCLVNPYGDFSLNGNPESYFEEVQPACINNEDYIMEYKCDQGSWGSRTKDLAVYLVAFADRNNLDFELFCDDYDNVLNYYGYEVQDMIPVQEFIKDCDLGRGESGCINQVCVLKYGQNIAMGVSLNTPIDGDKSFLYALGEQNNICTKGLGFNLCKDNIWYNEDIESILYIKGNPVSQNLDSIETVYFTNPYNIIVESQQDAKPTFKKIYLAKKDFKEIFAFYQENIYSNNSWPRDIIGLRYKNLNFEPCSYLQSINPSALCSFGQENDFKFSIAESEKALTGYWRDLTSKLRIIRK